jgi:ABC-type xylose transport system substrate-binding protein
LSQRGIKIVCPSKSDKRTLHETDARTRFGQSIPAINVCPIVVRKDNIQQTAIKDGFQNLETIQIRGVYRREVAQPEAGS